MNHILVNVKGEPKELFLKGYRSNALGFPDPSGNQFVVMEIKAVGGVKLRPLTQPRFGKHQSYEDIFPKGTILNWESVIVVI